MGKPAASGSQDYDSGEADATKISSTNGLADCIPPARSVAVQPRWSSSPLRLSSGGRATAAQGYYSHSLHDRWFRLFAQPKCTGFDVIDDAIQEATSFFS
ncbi:hypothetical protein VTN00DRAFT_7321 [Thermoascus crustaceus]|uniref:uncharacterized protein n=1 Tax=Thermoascus crustaceus TaxID=5088 RepID=UPI00374444D8